jgi:hypothetical protein
MLARHSILPCARTPATAHQMRSRCLWAQDVKQVERKTSSRRGCRRCGSRMHAISDRGMGSGPLPNHLGAASLRWIDPGVQQAWPQSRRKAASVIDRNAELFSHCPGPLGVSACVRDADWAQLQRKQQVRSAEERAGGARQRCIISKCISRVKSSFCMDGRRGASCGSRIGLVRL